jgi:hypothetical protein
MLNTPSFVALKSDQDTAEEWRSSPIRPDAYEVSSLGRVRSNFPWRPGRILSQKVKRGHGNYRQISLRIHGKDCDVMVHRLVAEAFHGSPEGRIARHLDGDSSNNAASNLAWGSPSENQLDSVQHGTHLNARKTQCPQGHPYDDENTRHYNGARICRTCSNSSTIKKTPKGAIRLRGGDVIQPTEFEFALDLTNARLDAILAEEVTA